MPTAQNTFDALGRLTSVTFPDGSKIVYEYDPVGNRTSVTTCCTPKFAVITKNASFSAIDGSGTLYRVTASATITLPASTGDGSIYKFKVTSGTGTFAFTGSDVINHADGTSDQILSLTSDSGVIELIAVSGGYDET